MSTQPAVVVTGPAHTPALAQLPTPTLSNPDDVLVRVRGVATNPVDTKIRLLLQMPLDKPWGIGFDTAGVVTRLGANVKNLKVGDEIFWCATMMSGGTMTQEVVVDSRCVGRKPASLGFGDAAALGMASLVAWNALHKHLQVEKHAGEWVYVHSGSSGMGSMGVQLAKAAGLKVVSSAGREDSRAWVKGLGADAVLDHSKDLKPQLEALKLQPVKLVFNAYTDDALGSILPILAPGGHVVSINFSRNEQGMPTGLPGGVIMQLFMLSATLTYECELNWGPRQAAVYDAVAKLIEAGTIKKISGHPGQHFRGLEGCIQAEQLQAQGKAIGKITVDLD